MAGCPSGGIPLFVLHTLPSIMGSVRRFSPLLLLLSLFLVSCGSSSSTDVTQCQTYWFDQIGACLPSSWKLLDATELAQRGVPEDVVIAFQSDTSVSGQFPTISVTREPLSSVVTPADYSDATIRSVSVLPGYKLIDQKKVTIDDVSLPVHVFFAQPLTGEPQRRFMQVSTVVGQNGYAITALTPLTVSSALESEIYAIFGSVTFVAPVTPAAN